MPAAVVWLIFAVGLAGAEALTGDMFLLMLGGGALSAAVTSWLLDWPVWSDGVVFLVASVLLLALVRPALRRRLTVAAVQTGVAALPGKNALVLDRIARQPGRVRLGGEVWTARALNDGDSYEPGDLVTVVRIDGATAVVWKNT